jgi:hypothetical protein
VSTKPWYHETVGPQFFNEWTIVHVVTGALWGAIWPRRVLSGMVAHTLYEMVEGKLFPVDQRDVSMRNHVGDSLAFLAGMMLTRRGRPTR